MSPSDDHSNQFSEGEFMRLFVRHEPALRAYARTILPDWNSVDDALQEASVTMWEKLGQLRDEDGFVPWAKVILRFKCLSALTDARRNRRVLNEDVLHLLADDAEAMQAEEFAEVQRAMSNCLGQFSDAHQELLLAPYTQEASVKRIAEECGKSAGAMYKVLERLREKLSTCIRRRIQTGAS